jgi:hypothetical protein
MTEFFANILGGSPKSENLGSFFSFIAKKLFIFVGYLLKNYLLNRIKKIELMKANLMMAGAMLLLLTNCTEKKPGGIRDAANEMKAAQDSQKNPEGVVEVQIKDNGAVVPNPNIREVTIHPADGHFHFKNVDRAGKVRDGKGNKGELEFTLAQDSLMRKYVAALAKVANNKSFDAQKPCVGMGSLEFTLIKATKDTVRFTIPGGSRCQKDIMPEAFALDELITSAIASGAIKADSHEGHDHKGHEGHDHDDHKGHDHKHDEKGHKH